MNTQRHGLVPGITHLALDLVERSQTTTIGVLQDVRGELRVVVDSGLDLTEKTLGALIRIARKLTKRIDDAVAETLTNGEQLLIGRSEETSSVVGPRHASA